MSSPVLNELQQLALTELVGKATGNVRVKHPVHLFPAQASRQRIELVARAALWPEPVRGVEKVLFAYDGPHLDDSALKNLVIQERNAKRPLPAIALGDARPAGGPRPVYAAVDTSKQVFCRPSGPVRSSPTSFDPPLGRLRVDGRISRSQTREIDAVRQPGELCIFVLTCYFAHTIAPRLAIQSGSASRTCRAVYVPLTLADLPPSSASAAGTPALFSAFVRTTGLPDFPRSFLSRLPP